MKALRIVLVLVSVLLVSTLFFACTGSVGGAEESDEIRAEATVHCKVVAPGAKEDGSDDILLEQEIRVISKTKPSVSIKDLSKTLVNDNYLSGTVISSTITDFGGYEATSDSEHIWSWALNGDADVGSGVALKTGDSVVYSYLKISEVNSDGGEEVSMTVAVNISAGAQTLYSDDYTSKSSSLTVKNLLSKLTADGKVNVVAAGSITQIDNFVSDSANEWVVYVNDESVNLRKTLSDGDLVEVVYQAK